MKDYLPRDAKGEVDLGLECRAWTEIGSYIVSTIGRSGFTRFVDPAREMLFDCYPYEAIGETLVLHSTNPQFHYAAITYLSREQLEEGHNVIANLLDRDITDWLRPHGLENTRRWGYVRRGLLKRLETEVQK